MQYSPMISPLHQWKPAKSPTVALWSHITRYCRYLSHHGLRLAQANSKYSVWNTCAAKYYCNLMITVVKDTGAICFLYFRWNGARFALQIYLYKCIIFTVPSSQAQNHMTVELFDTTKLETVLDFRKMFSERIDLLNVYNSRIWIMVYYP